MSSKATDNTDGKPSQDVTGDNSSDNSSAAQRRTVIQSDETKTKSDQSSSQYGKDQAPVSKEPKDKPKVPESTSQEKGRSLLEDVPSYKQYPFPPSPSPYGAPFRGPGTGPSIPGMPPGTFPRIGGRDLDPFGPPEFGGMLFDPFQQRQRPNFSPNLPPGARYDPVTPFPRPRPPFPPQQGEPDPDHEKLPHKRWNDPFI